MINITFPDNTIKSFENNPSGMDIAKSISDGFARNCVAMKIDERLLDLNLSIKEDTAISQQSAISQRLVFNVLC
ncbi:MAG: hypothetical protein K8S13_10990 [Desulfobacula sp.]|uniref:hypothetical protein n=1 Tax=Desulfobacula sp. TaxID=2593537 RepID=UPI0025B8CFD4|nr:hypothetical protein [Desulfobacula sp.]MCD4720365.1 hypothetical protein [Desulfobacula sp.]